MPRPAAKTITKSIALTMQTIGHQSSIIAETFRDAFKELIFGQRGIIKANPTWLVVSFAALHARENQPGLLQTDLFGFFLWAVMVYCIAVSWGQASILFNDCIDRKSDQFAGKKRWIFRVSSFNMTMAYSIPLLWYAIPVFILIFLNAPGRIMGWYICGLLISIAYSSSPIRLKEKGIRGIFSYSIACSILYAILPGDWAGLGPKLLLIVSAAILLDKWVNLHFHQIIDYDSDRQSGISTFTTKVGLLRSRKILRAMCWLTSIFFGAVIVTSFMHLEKSFLLLIFSVVSFFIILLFILQEKKKEEKKQLIQELPSVYLILTLIVFRVIPVYVLGFFAIEALSLWPLSLFFFVTITMAIELLQMVSYKYH